MDNLFDLNIEKVLEHWGVEHAIREIIANALDEMTLTGTKKSRFPILMVCAILETTGAGCNTYILRRMKTKKNLLRLT